MESTIIGDAAASSGNERPRYAFMLYGRDSLYQDDRDNNTMVVTERKGREEGWETEGVCRKKAGVFGSRNRQRA